MKQIYLNYIKFLTLIKLNNNNQLQGRKMRNHKINSIPKSKSHIEIALEMESISLYDMVAQLITDNSVINIYKNTSAKIKEEFITTEYEKLSDDFLNPDFKINTIHEYFDEDAWHSVIQLYDMKKKICTCPICNAFSVDKSIQCCWCKYWYHWQCEVVSYYYQKNSKNWKCKNCLK